MKCMLPMYNSDQIRGQSKWLTFNYRKNMILFDFFLHFDVKLLKLSWLYPRTPNWTSCLCPGRVLPLFSNILSLNSLWIHICKGSYMYIIQPVVTTKCNVESSNRRLRDVYVMNEWCVELRVSVTHYTTVHSEWVISQMIDLCIF